MDDREKIYLSISPDVGKFLADNGFTIAELLAKANLDAELSLGEDPTLAGSGRKDPATIILASAAAIAAATPLLRQLIGALAGRPAVIRERQLVQTRKTDGSAAVDVAGNPIMEWRETERPNADKLNVKGLGLEISFESN